MNIHQYGGQISSSIHGLKVIDLHLVRSAAQIERNHQGRSTTIDVFELKIEGKSNSIRDTIK